MDQSQPFFDSATLITIGASLLVSAAAFIVMRFYLRAIFRESQRSASLATNDTAPRLREHQDLAPAEPAASGQLAIEVEQPPVAGPAALRSPTFRHAEATFRRAAAVYALGGSIHAATSVALLSTLSPPSFASRLTEFAYYAGRFWVWSFFTLIALTLFCGPDRRIRGVLIAAYIVALPALGALLQFAGAPSISFTELAAIEPLLKAEASLLFPAAEAATGLPVSPDSLRFPPLWLPVLFWALSGAPVALPLIAFNRLVRGTVGPLFINLALLMVLTTLLLNDVWVRTALGVRLLGQIKPVLRDYTFAAMTLTSLSLAIVVAVLGVLWIARRYRRHRLSDQTFLFDGLWLSASIWVCVYLMGHPRRFYYLLGLVPYALYKLTVAIGLRRSRQTTTALPEARLLYLRVFGSPGRAESLFDVLAARWRYAGSIQLISATDMARGHFEPDEFLDFLNRKLADSYISSDSDLDRRLATLRHRPDPDARYRVHELFCRADTWQRTVAVLAGSSSLVIMDLRAFTSGNKGCIFELSVLLDEVPLDRVALLIDETTDEPLLRQTLTDLWGRVRLSSPNAGLPARLRFVDLAGGYPAAVRHLVLLADQLVA